MAGGFFLLGADELLTTYLYVGNCDRATVVIDAPAVLLDTIDTLCVCTYIVDIHGKNRIIGINIDVIHIVGRACKPITR